MPDINQDIDIEINDDDLRIDTYRSSGAGGQHINKNVISNQNYTSSNRNCCTVSE